MTSGDSSRAIAIARSWEGINVILCVHVYASLCVYMCVHRLPKYLPPPFLSLAHYFEAKKGEGAFAQIFNSCCANIPPSILHDLEYM